MSEINSPVLVINSGWTAIHSKSMKDAIADVFSEVAEIVEHATTNIVAGDQIVSTFGSYYDWPSWTQLSQHAIPQLQNLAKEARLKNDIKTAELYEPRVVYTTRGPVRGPEVIRLPNYNDVPDMEIRLTRRNLLLRDGFTCQYCGKRVTINTFTVDHVMPRSKGGQGTWTNFAVACFPCNVKKRDRTPQEAGMRLLSKPGKPKWYPLTMRFHHKMPVSWERFLPKSAFVDRPQVENLSERRKK